MEVNRSEDNKKFGIYLLPNLFTIGALFAGFYAIVASLKGFYDLSSISIFVAILLDGLDGRVARLTNTVTKFGAELDSISDMVSFGVAPSLLIFSCALQGLGKIGWLIAFIYTASTALRLARFNVQASSDNKNYFQGLSSTASAALVASVVWLCRDLEIHPHSLNILLACLTAILAILMVSNVRYRSFKDADLKNHVSFVVILIVVLVMVLISIDPAKVLFGICFLYASSGPCELLWKIYKNNNKHVKRTLHKLGLHVKIANKNFKKNQ